jgi:hypothetical protein
MSDRSASCRPGHRSDRWLDRVATAAAAASAGTGSTGTANSAALVAGAKTMCSTRDPRLVQPAWSATNSLQRALDRARRRRRYTFRRGAVSIGSFRGDRGFAMVPDMDGPHPQNELGRKRRGSGAVKQCGNRLMLDLRELMFGAHSNRQSSSRARSRCRTRHATEQVGPFVTPIARGTRA